MTRTPLPVRISKVLAVLAVFLYLLHALTAGTDEITQPPPASITYGERLAAEHDCWASGRQELPSAAVVTFRDDIAPRFTTDPAEVDAAFRAALGENVPGVFSVTALCTIN